MIYFCMKKISQFASWMGPRGWRLWGTFLGTLLWWFLPSSRRSVLLNNLKISLDIDDEKARQLGKENCINMGILMIEALALPKLTPENIRDWVSIEGEEYLKEAMNEGKGVLIATAHQGNWEWMGAALALYGYPLVAVMTPQHNQAANDFIKDLRSGAHMILAMRAEVRDMIRHLRAGHMVGLLMDQFAPQSEIEVEFFGRKTKCQPGTAVLARMQGAPVVPGFIHRLPNGRHQLTIYPVMHIDSTQDKHEAQWELTRDLIKIIEDYIRAHPAEWFWLHDRWKIAGRARRSK